VPLPSVQLPSSLKAARLRRWGVIGGVVLLHVGLFAVLGRVGPEQRLPTLAPPVLVTLFRPPPPPPPPPPPVEPSARPGGGAPAAPSRVHTPPPPPVRPPDSPPAPREPAPEPAIVVGAAPTASVEPGFGQGGQGTGTGSGTGAGDGPGSGGRGPVIVRGPTQGEILALVPPEARAARQAGRASVNCEIQLDTRLDQCRVVSETPAGFGFGQAALTIAPRYFRFRPPVSAAGQTMSGARVTVYVEFGRQNRR